MNDTTRVISARRGMLVGGRWTTSGSRGEFDKRNPATGRSLHPVPLGGAAEIDEAVEVAHRAFPAWRATAPGARRDIL
ncbi:MAG: aldehyde dehydrogenase family protein, partial [Candidatus Binatia bacterium]